MRFTLITPTKFDILTFDCDDGDTLIIFEMPMFKIFRLRIALGQHQAMRLKKQIEMAYAKKEPV